MNSKHPYRLEESLFTYKRKDWFLLNTLEYDDLKLVRDIGKFKRGQKVSHAMILWDTGHLFLSQLDRRGDVLDECEVKLALTVDGKPIENRDSPRDLARTLFDYERAEHEHDYSTYWNCTLKQKVGDFKKGERFDEANIYWIGGKLYLERDDEVDTQEEFDLEVTIVGP